VFCADIAVDKTPRDVPKRLSIAVFLFFVASHFLILFCTTNSYLDSTGVLSSAEKVQSSIRSLKICAGEDMSSDLSEDPVEEQTLQVDLLSRVTPIFKVDLVFSILVPLR
jgi:hypothetical protein